jgi:MFS family permease
LALASLAVAFAAADTYVVVLALPDMMAGAGLPIDALQKASPIVSGFLLGYVAVLPLIGRIADLQGRIPVLVGSLLVFSLGSLLTAASHDLSAMVVGRLLQGIGAGGLVPATLALVADLYPPHRRAIPLGLVGAVQEIGSVLGPLLGAAVIAVRDWRGIFWLNLVVALLIAAILRSRRDTDDSPRPGLWGFVLAGATLAALLLLLFPPAALVDDLTWGLLFVPAHGDSVWLTPMAAVLALGVLALGVHGRYAARPLLRVTEWRRVLAESDLPGSALMALGLGAIIVTFASADPEIQVFAPHGAWYLAGSALCFALFTVHARRARHPLVPRGLLRPAPAWGSLVASFLIGSALIVALVDIPVFARVTIYPDSQLDAAFVLVRFLVAVPVGAVAGGYLAHRWPTGVITLTGSLLVTGGFLVMSTWGLATLESWQATPPLLVTGLGFGLVLAPINAALLVSTDARHHGLASSLVVVARMVGMLVGISALTTLALHRYYGVLDGLASIQEVCGTPTSCSAYTLLLKEAGLVQMETAFYGAAACAFVGGLLALFAFRGVDTRSTSPELVDA